MEGRMVEQIDRRSRALQTMSVAEKRKDRCRDE
jgi:hypothetical protein